MKKLLFISLFSIYFFGCTPEKIAPPVYDSDYGKGLADVYESFVKSLGIKVTAVTAHEEGKADYGAEVATLAAAGGEALAVLGYLDQAGGSIIQGSLESGACDKFVLSDGMYGESLTKRFGKDLNNKMPTKKIKKKGILAILLEVSELTYNYSNSMIIINII